MNLILLSKEDFLINQIDKLNNADTRVRISGRRFRHITDVHRASVGDNLIVGLKNSSCGIGTIIKVNGDYVEMDVSLNIKPPEPLPVTLVLSLPRPKVLKRVLISIASMGIKKLYLINSRKVEKSYWQSPVLSKEKIESQISLGLEQSKDTVFPEIILKKGFKPFLEDELPDIIKNSTPLLAHPFNSIRCPGNIDTNVTLAIGPEGGFIPYEVEKFIECGFKPVNLGDRILRVETVLPALIYRLF